MRKSVVPFLLFAMWSASSWATGQMKPGLWEMTMKSDALKNMPKIPPEQLEQMRRMGINMPQMQDGGMVTRVCVTRQMADSDQLPGMQDNETGCETKNMQRSGNSFTADIVCNGTMVKGTGKAKGTFSGSGSFTSTYDFNGTMHGQPVDQHHVTTGKWLGAECGSVKPPSDMMPRK